MSIIKKPKKWFEDWEVTTYVGLSMGLPARYIRKEFKLPNSRNGNTKFDIFCERGSDVAAMADALESALSELGSRAKS